MNWQEFLLLCTINMLRVNKSENMQVNYLNRNGGWHANTKSDYG